MENMTGPCPIIVRLCEGMYRTGVEEKDYRKHIKSITGISKQNIMHWFNGTTKTPNPIYLAELSAYFNIDLNWLITGKISESNEKSSKYVGSETPLHNKDQYLSNLKNDTHDCVHRLCQGILDSGAKDAKISLIETATNMYSISSQTVLGWLNKESEPSIVQIGELCERYGIATRYVLLGLGPVLALDYISASDKENRHEVIQFKDVALLGNV